MKTLQILRVMCVWLLVGFAHPVVAGVTIVSGNGQAAAAGTRLGEQLVVQVDCSAIDGVPVPLPCGRVEWTSSDSGDSFTPNPSVTTGNSFVTAQSSTQLTFGSNPGPRVITATSQALQSVATFAVTALGFEVAIVSGNNQTATTNTALAQPFVVSVTQNDSNSTASVPDGTEVTWTVSGAGELADGRTTTVVNGQASNTLIIGSVLNGQTVSATVAGGNTVVFTVNGETATVDPGLPLPAQAVAGALDKACAATAEEDSFSEFCNQIEQLTGSDLGAALQQLAPTQLSTQGTSALQTQTVQSTNVGARLTELHAGGSGVSVSGLAFNIAGLLLPVAAFSKTDKTAQHSAAADENGFSRWGAFVNGQIIFGNQDPTAVEPGFDVRTQGLTAGVDYRFTDQWVMGTAVGYVQTKSDFDLSAGGLKTHGINLSVFGTYYQSAQLYVDGILTFGRNQYDSKRHVVFTGFDGTAQGATDSQQTVLGLNAGYDFHRDALNFGPYVRLNYATVKVDGFTETGGGAAALTIGAQTITSFTTDLGGQCTYALNYAWGVLTPNLKFEWEHEHRNGSRLISASFVADPAHTVFAIPTQDPDRNYFNINLGAVATFQTGKNAFFNYQTLLGRSYITEHLITAGVRIEF